MGALDTAEPGQERLFNLGNTHPHTVSELVSGLENVLGKSAVRHYVDLPNLGDVLQTHSNISAAAAAFNYSPQVRNYLMHVQYALLSFEMLQASSSHFYSFQCSGPVG